MQQEFDKYISLRLSKKKNDTNISWQFSAEVMLVDKVEQIDADTAELAWWQRLETASGQP